MAISRRIAAGAASLVAGAGLVACSSGPSSEVAAACSEWIDVAVEHDRVDVGAHFSEGADLTSLAANLTVAADASLDAGGNFEELESLGYGAAGALVRGSGEAAAEAVHRAINSARQDCIRANAWDLCETQWILTGATAEAICGPSSE